MALLTIKDRILLARAKGDAQERIKAIEDSILNGDILGPLIPTPPLNFAGGTNHCPNSDFSYSKAAAEVAGTMPGDAGDDNQEAWRWYWVEPGADVVLDDIHALKAVDHSLYAATEGSDTEYPIWDRVNGWPVFGNSHSNRLFDIVAVLRGKVVNAGQKWFMRFLITALDDDIVPVSLELYAGFWYIYGGGAGQGWIEGGDYAVSVSVHGTPGTVTVSYRVLAKTDSGIAMLSAVQTITNAPDVFDEDNCPEIHYDGGPGFIEYDIYRLLNGVYEFLYSVRNSVDLTYFDTGEAHKGQVEGWPAEPETKPKARAQTRNIDISNYGATSWGRNDLTIQVAPTFDFSQADPEGIMLRIGLNGVTTNDRQLAIDRIFLSTSYNEWSPDLMQAFPDGTFPVPTIEPTEGNQGGSGGVSEPPDPGSGGGSCITQRLPVLMIEGRRHKWLTYAKTIIGDLVKGGRLPFQILKKKQGIASGYYVIKTTNEITYECNARHLLFTDIECRDVVQARQVKEGMKLSGWVNGRDRLCTVKSIKFIPRPIEVGTYVLRDLSGERADGRGIFIAGRSKGKDRGLKCRNTKPLLDQ